MVVAEDSKIRISAPKMETSIFKIVGTAPYVQARFSEKAKNLMRAKMEAGSQAKKGTQREPRDFEADYKAAMHISVAGWPGIPASAFRKAMISACRLVGFKMTLAKLALFVDADGFDVVDGLPLIRIEGTPEPVEMAVRNETGVADIRVRPMWREWEATVRIRFDADMFTLPDLANLLMRAGQQVGVGEGRPDSRKSCGLGWGLFALKDK